MRKNFVTIVTALLATLSSLSAPAHAASRQAPHSHKAQTQGSNTSHSSKMDPYNLRYGPTYGRMVKELIGDINSAKLQLSTVAAAACSALRNNPNGDHPYQQTLQFAYKDIAEGISSPRPPAFNQAMKECANVFDRTAVR